MSDVSSSDPDPGPLEVERLTVQAYDWSYEDTVDEKDHVVIQAWCLDRESNPHLIKFKTFPTFCYVELPTTVSGRSHFWNQDQVSLVADRIKDALKLEEEDPDAAQGYCVFASVSKLYYYNPGVKYPMLRLKFPTVSMMNRCLKLLEKPLEVRGVGTLNLKVWEAKIPLYRKMLTLRKCGMSQWFTVSGVKERDRISTLEREYVCDWTSLTPVSPEISTSWRTHPRVLAFDIETYSDNHKTMPNRFNSKNPAYMISLIYQKLGILSSRKRYLIIMGDCDPIAGTEIIKVDNELDLCAEMARLVNELDPEIVTGYNIFGYDYSYLTTRLKKNLWDWPIMGRLIGRKTVLKSKTWKSDAYGFQDLNMLSMPGRINLDMLPIVRRDYKYPKYDLDTVGKELLGRGKHPVKAKEMFVIYEELVKATKELQLATSSGTAEEMAAASARFASARREMTRVSEYCVEDSELVIDLIEKTNTWIGLVELSNIVGVTIVDLFTRGQQIRCMSQIYDLCKSLQIVIDHRPSTESSFKGGFVNEPDPGLHDFTDCLDFKSLYPSIIQAFNICYTTYIPERIWNRFGPDDYHSIKVEETLTGDVVGGLGSVGDDDDEDEEWDDSKGAKGSSQAAAAPTTILKEYRFIKAEKFRGVLPQLVSHLVNERNKVRGQQKKVTDPLDWVVLEKRQLALKVSANSIFGFLGIPDGKLPFMEGAKCITSKGRELINFCNDYLVKTYGAKIVYNDTDSTMFVLPFVKSNKEAMEWGHRLEHEISALFPDPLYTEFEKGGRMFCLKKKKYIFWQIEDNFKKADDHPYNFMISDSVTAYSEDVKHGQKVDKVFGSQWKSNKFLPEGGTGDTLVSLSELWDPCPSRIKRVEEVSVTDPLTGEKFRIVREVKPDFLVRGIILARRDNCQWQRSLYNKVVDNIIEKFPLMDTYDIILEDIKKLVKRGVSHQHLVTIKGLGAGYASESYPMKIFSDELRRIGKPAVSGERLEYVVVKTKEEMKEYNTYKDKKRRVTKKKVSEPAALPPGQTLITQYLNPRLVVEQVEGEAVASTGLEGESTPEEARGEEPPEEMISIVRRNKQGKVLLGCKMRTPDTYLERLETPYFEIIDNDYYIDKVITKCIEQLFVMAYRVELAELEEYYTMKDYKDLFRELAGMGYEKTVRLLFEKFQGDIEQIMAYLKTSPLKYKVNKLRAKYIGRRNQFTGRIDSKPIQSMSKIIKGYHTTMNELVYKAKVVE